MQRDANTGALLFLRSERPSVVCQSLLPFLEGKSLDTLGRVQTSGHSGLFKVHHFKISVWLTKAFPTPVAGQICDSGDVR